MDQFKALATRGTVVLAMIALAIAITQGAALASAQKAVDAEDVGLASVGLPYQFTVTSITGGMSGINTPTFYTNSTGRLCVNSNLSIGTNQWYGGGPMTGSYFIRFREKRTFWSDITHYTMHWSAASDGYKRCVINLPINTEMYLNIQKTNFEQGVYLHGSGTVTYN